MKTLKAALLSLIPAFSLAGVHVQQGDPYLNIGSMTVSGAGGASVTYGVVVGSLTCTGSPCGTGGGGSGSVVASTQNNVAYYSGVATNTINGILAGTTNFGLLSGGSGASPFWNQVILGTSTLQSGATFYVSSGTISGGNFTTALGTVTLGGYFVNLGDSNSTIYIAGVGNGGGGGLQRFITISTTVAGNPIQSSKIYPTDIPDISASYIKNTPSLQSGAVFYVSSGTVQYGLTVGSLTIVGSSAASQSLTEGAASTAFPSASGKDIFWADSSSHAISGTFNGSVSTYTWLSSSFTPVAGQFPIWVASGPNSWVVGSSVPAGGGGGGSGTVGSANVSNVAYYTAATTVGGSNNFQFNGTSVTVVSSVTIGTSGNNNSPFLSVHSNTSTAGDASYLFDVGSINSIDQFLVENGAFVYSQYGYYSGRSAMQLDTNSAPDALEGYNNGTDEIDLGSVAGQISLTTTANSQGGTGNPIIFRPTGITAVAISTFGVTVSTQTTITSSETVKGTVGIYPSTTTSTYSLYMATATVGGNSVAISTTGEFVLAGSTGTSGQALTSQGPGVAAKWTTISGGSGSGIVSPGTYTWTNNFGISGSTLVFSTITATTEAILPGATFFTNVPGGATTPSVNLSSVTVINGETINVKNGDGSTGLVINQFDTTNNKAGEIINSSGTDNGLIVNANGVNYGTGVSSGAFNVSCLGEQMQGNCGQVYNHGGAQSVLNGVWNIVQDSPTWNTVTEYIIAGADNPQNGIRIDGYDYSTVEFIDTLKDGAGPGGGGGAIHNGKFQISSHNGQMRGEVRASDNSGFIPAWQVADSTAAGVMSIGNSYGVPVSTLEVQGGVTIGNGIAGASGSGLTSPLNGLIVQGASVFQSSIAVTSSLATSTYTATFSSNAAGPFTLDISTTGHLNSQAVVGATVTSCGTNPSYTGSDMAATITTGSGSPTTCNFTFFKPYKNAPTCVASDTLDTAVVQITSISNATVTMAFSAALNSGKIFLICIGSD